MLTGHWRRIGSCASVALLLLACGPKRPPAVSTDRSRTSSTGARSGTAGADDTIDSGPDLQQIPEDGTRSEDLIGGSASPEGGPLADVYFDYDQAGLSDAARATLDRHAQWLQARPDVRVSVAGHCDERGTVDYNLALGDQRAKAVREYLVSLGVAEARLTAVSYGKERPVDNGHDDAAWAKNRRAHFAVSR